MNVTKMNFDLIAAKFYTNISCESIDEFKDDMNRFKYIGRLINRYQTKGELKTNLILNHLVVLYNVIDHEILTKLLCVKFNKNLSVIKTFLLFLGYWPEKVDGVNGETIISSDIPLDNRIITELRSIANGY